MEQLFLHHLNTPLLSKQAGFPKMLDIYLNDVELFVVTLSGLSSLVTGNS